MKNLKTNVFFKAGTMLVIAMLLLIPTMMIRGLIAEREVTQNEAIVEVGSKWGLSQTISGPFISIPYIKHIKETPSNTSIETIREERNYIHILPTELNISGEISPEKRARGNYSIVVYNSKLIVSGKFNGSDFSEFDIPQEDIQFDKARLTTGISDLIGIEDQIKLTWNGVQYVFDPGVVTSDVVKSGVNSNIDLNPADSADYSFSFSIDLKGSQSLYFTPVGKVTEIKLKSNWQDPKFNGAFLPDSRSVSDAGFEATWKVININRNYPQIWTGNSYSIDQSAFGVDLFLSVDNYQKLSRSIKYAILFIAFTFLVFFFIEVLKKVFLHPVQYVLVGIALVVFYTLLLSITEHSNFNIAFAISATSTLLLIAGYVKAILRSNQITVLVSGILLFLYGFIFVIIQLEDFALLLGSIVVFLTLGLVMYFSRKIDWYNISLKEKQEL